MFNIFEQLFAPGRKHTDDERNRLALTRTDVGDGDPGRGPIDLASGKVVMRAAAQNGPEDTESPGAPESAEGPGNPESTENAENTESGESGEVSKETEGPGPERDR
ncbi:DUF6191 domain-containing protein [Streptomyces sp. NPDC004838]